MGEVRLFPASRQNAGVKSSSALSSRPAAQVVPLDQLRRKSPTTIDKAGLPAPANLTQLGAHFGARDGREIDE